VLIAQALLGAASCLLVHGISRELSDDRRVARGAALVCALCGPLIYFDAQLLSASLDVFLGLLLLRLLLLAGRRGSALLWPAAGLVAGLSALNRGAILLFAPFALVWIARLAHPPTGRSDSTAASGRRAGGLLAAASFAVALALVVLPISWHNARYDSPGEDTRVAAGLRRLASGGFVPIASNSGLNFYLGNHPSLREMNRVEHPDHMAMYNRIRLEAVEEGITSFSAANRSLVAKTLVNAARWPGDWLALMGLKLAELVNGTEIPRNTSIYADRAFSPVLSALLWRFGLGFPSGLLIPLGLVGIALARDEWRRHFLVLCALGAQALFVTAFFVTSRYRLPMLPLLAPYAVSTAVTLFDAWRAGPRARAERLTGALAFVMAICNVPIVAVSAGHHWMEHNNLAVALIEQERRDEAEEHLRRAVQLNPESTVAATGLCDLLLDSERPRDALPFCRAAVVAGPDSAAAHYSLGAGLEAIGRSPEAVRHYREAARLAPQAGEPRTALRRLEATP
jgi:tetratricopeptide (TPR) repeat protein